MSASFKETIVFQGVEYHTPTKLRPVVLKCYLSTDDLRCYEVYQILNGIIDRSVEYYNRRRCWSKVKELLKHQG